MLSTLLFPIPHRHPYFPGVSAEEDRCPCLSPHTDYKSRKGFLSYNKDVELLLSHVNTGQFTKYSQILGEYTVGCRFLYQTELHLT